MASRNSNSNMPDTAAAVSAHAATAVLVFSDDDDKMTIDDDVLYVFVFLALSVIAVSGSFLYKLHHDSLLQHVVHSLLYSTVIAVMLYCVTALPLAAVATASGK